MSDYPRSRYRLVEHAKSDMTYYCDCVQCGRRFLGMFTQDYCGACLRGRWGWKPWKIPPAVGRQREFWEGYIDEIS